MLDPVKNFAIATVSTGYDAAATSIVLSSGQGAKFPATFSYNVVWWNSTDYTSPADDATVEIVRVTGRSTDTLTITRAQEGTSAATHNTGGKTYSMMLGITAKMITDIDTARTLVDAEVTFAKMANLAQDKLIGRQTASTGVPEVIACTAAGRALIDDASATAQLATLGLDADIATLALPANTTITAAGAALIDDAAATDQLATLGAEPLAPVAAAYTPATGSQTVALNVTTVNMHVVTGHASGTAITFTITGATNNQPFVVSILQGGTTVSTITAWFATIRWAGGTAPTLTATLNKRDTFGFIRTGANTYDGFVIGQNA